jgi:hypothetical protein
MSGDRIAGMHGCLLPNLEVVIGLKPAWMLHCRVHGQGFIGYEQNAESGIRKW